MAADISRRIASLRYVLICAVILVHMPPTDPAGPAPGSAFEYIRAFFQHALGRTAVPTLTCISGYLLFRSASDLSPAALIKKRARTLLVPLLFWNAVSLAITPMAVAFHLVGRTDWLGEYLAEPVRLLDWTLAVTGVPANQPLYFLRDLFTLVLLAPAFGWILRRAPLTGLVVVSSVFASGLAHPLLLQDSMAISFYLGGLAAVLNWDLRTLDRYWPLAAVLLIVACTVIVTVPISNLLPFRLVVPFLVWPIGGALVSSRMGGAVATLSPASFLIFVSHAPAFRILSRIQHELADTIALPVFWFTAPLLVVGVCHLCLPVMQRISPGFARLALGGRILMVGTADGRADAPVEELPRSAGRQPGFEYR